MASKIEKKKGGNKSAPPNLSPASTSAPPPPPPRTIYSHKILKEAFEDFTDRMCLFKPGQVARIDGVKGRKDLTGKLVEVNSELREQGEYEVKFIADKNDEAQKFIRSVSLLHGGFKSPLEDTLCLVNHANLFHVCNNCHAAAAPLAGSSLSLSSVVLACSACRIVAYCGAACQKEDWSKHRALCRQTERKRAVNKAAYYEEADCPLINAIMPAVQGGALGPLGPRLEKVRALIKQGADVNRVLKGQSTALGAAACTGQLNIVKLLVESGSKVDPPLPISALAYAISRSHPLVVEYLVNEAGADFRIADKDGYSPLHIASMAMSLPIVTFLCQKGADINLLTKAGRGGRTPLREAVSSVDGGIVAKRAVALYLCGVMKADVNLADSDGRTPLIAACREAANIDVNLVPVLVEHGADVDKGDKRDVTPVHCAACRGRLSVIQYLAEHGADTLKPDVDGCTPLYSASQGGHLNVVKYLCDTHDADKNPKEGKWLGRSPLHTAIDHNHFLVVEYLVKRGADVNRVDDSNRASLHFAALCKSVKILNFILQQSGVEKDKQDKEGSTALLLASQIGECLMNVKCLVEHGASLDVKNDNGWTPLFLAAQQGHLEIVKILAKEICKRPKSQAAAALSANDKYGFSPCSIALEFGHKNVSDYLLNLGRGAEICYPTDVAVMGRDMAAHLLAFTGGERK